MFRPKKVEKATVYALNKDQNAVLSKLHKIGLLHIINLKTVKESSELAPAIPTENLKHISELLLRVSRIRAALDLAPVKLSFSQSVSGLDLMRKRKVPGKESKVLINETEKFLRNYEEPIIELEKRHNDLVTKIDEDKKLKEIIELFESHDLHLSLLEDTERLSISAGSMPLNLVPKLKEELKKDTDGYCHLMYKRETKKEAVIVTMVLKEYSGKVNFLLKKYGVQIFLIPPLPEVAHLKKWIDAGIEKAEKEKKDIVSKISEYRKKIFEGTVVLREEVWILKEKFEAVHKMVSSESFFVVQGWVISKYKERIVEAMKEATHGVAFVDFNPPNDDEEVPVELTNPFYLKPFEMLTELYALPKYGGVDPTFIVGPLFLIYAGFMLTDFVYGLLLFVAGLFIIKKFGKYDVGLKYMSINLAGMGFTTMVFGVLTGSYLGDAPSYLFGVTPSQLAIWKDPMVEPLYFLIVSIVVALVHLNIGLFIGILEDIRKKNWKAMVSERVVWVTLQVGIACIYFHVFELFGKILMGLTFLTIVVLSGPIGVLGVTGFMGDVISYSRLFALALSTAGIALAVNLLTELVAGIPFVGIFLAIIMFIVGHLFGFLMNAIGGFVHSLRLQFVEFFGKFYEGGGDRFEPFAEERIYTEVKKE